MSFLNRFFGRRPDPTVNWTVVRPPIPAFDVSRMRFGTLGFGDPIDAAAFLGRPEAFQWTQGDYCTLLYASHGFQIDFSSGKFAYLAFFIGPDDYLPKHRSLQFSSPGLLGRTPDHSQLSRETSRETLQHLFGSSDSSDVDPNETILSYTRHGVTMEFEMSGGATTLTRWNCYPAS